ncbi:MAG: alpha/beta hydrolase [Microbacterium sp.]
MTLTEGSALDPEVAVVRGMLRAAGLHDFQTTAPIERARAGAASARIRFYPQVPVPVASIDDREVPRPGGSIPVRIIRPLDADLQADLEADLEDADRGGVAPIVVYSHGGGFCLGDLDAHEAHARLIAARVGAIVVNVGYRLAPEHPFPAGLDDVVAVVRWVADNAPALGADPARIAVAGDSAGGNLALAAALECGVPVAAQLLFYPPTDLAAGPPGVVERWYVGDRVELLTDPRVSPVRAAALASAPPIVLATGAHDFLCDDNTAFAARLRALGVPHRAHVFPSLDHGFLSFVSVADACARAADTVLADFRTLLRKCG